MNRRVKGGDRDRTFPALAGKRPVLAHKHDRRVLGASRIRMLTRNRPFKFAMRP